ncbi:MAG TPA: hypothetical protein VMV51_05525 [Gemmatimonadaceae bacterium]|nr:hypothetical protein [Gemmatimonadaceae bacterium]
MCWKVAATAIAAEGFEESGAVGRVSDEQPTAALEIAATASHHPRDA